MNQSHALAQQVERVKIRIVALALRWRGAIEALGVLVLVETGLFWVVAIKVGSIICAIKTASWDVHPIIIVGVVHVALLVLLLRIVRLVLLLLWVLLGILLLILLLLVLLLLWILLRIRLLLWILLILSSLLLLQILPLRLHTLSLAFDLHGLILYRRRCLRNAVHFGVILIQFSELNRVGVVLVNQFKPASNLLFGNVIRPR